jgi:hypothetical protein
MFFANCFDTTYVLFLCYTLLSYPGMGVVLSEKKIKVII